MDALGGAPSAYSARYAKAGASDADRRACLLRALRKVPPPRPARFRCVIAIAQPGEPTTYFEGVCEGGMLLEERGTNGSGYDPLFFMPGCSATMTELPAAVKTQFSHRARAAQAARRFLQHRGNLGRRGQ